jgi:S-adenosylmethionine hydrolase
MTIITLTTDFGWRDPFVGVMKGVILGINRHVHLVDLTHEIAPHDVLEGALALEAAVPFFPPGTIHVAVVDPGVGSDRRALGLAARGQTFVGPDNGLFTFLLSEPGWRAAALENLAYALPSLSRTFHGRDRFAPAAAHLSRGVSLDSLGPPATDLVQLRWLAGHREGERLVGEVVHIDRFGNLITSVRTDDVESLGPPDAVAVEVAGWLILGLSRSYVDRRAGEPGAIVGSSQRLEIFVREASARTVLSAERGTPVRLWKR